MSNEQTKPNTATELTEKQLATAQKILTYKLAAEANVVSILYKKPDYLYDVELSIDDISNNAWKVFFQIIYDIIVLEKKQVADEITIGLYLEKHPKLKAKYEEYGGYNTVVGGMGYVKAENFYGYYDELKKWKCVLALCKNGFPIEDELSVIQDLTCDELYKNYETILNHIFVNAEENVKNYNAFEGYDAFIEELDNGREEGFPFYNAKILNDEVGGFNLDGNIYGLGAGSGVGKSTLAFNLIVPSAIEKNEKVVFIINEEDEKKFKKEMLIWVANNIFLSKPDEYLHKKELRKGHFSETTKELLKKCGQWIEQKKQEHIFTIMPLERYSVRTAIRIIKKYSAAYGVRVFVLDTFKESFDAKTDEIYKSMMRDMVALYDTIKAKAKNVGLFVTYQLGKGSIKMRHLTNNEIGQAKSILDVMSVNLMIRRPYEDEYDGEKRALKCWYTPEGANSNTRITYKLKPENNPMIMFITKNRFGETDRWQIVSECDFSTNKIKDVSYCIVPQDW